MRLDSAISLSDSICSRSGNLPQESDLASAAALANFSFGQGELLLSPLHLSELYCVINNGGYDCGARLVEGRIIAGELQKRQSQPKTRVIKGDNYTVLVMKENGTSGSHDCGPVFKQICDVLNTLEQEKSG